ncbi:hypothetical protein F5050DRAFT_32500 [Lentinula boryana]|uniref:Secreted protein n=1 Tax=Lentinula boryana TaxID=40481 RepID=A0ABQ8QSB5_9AGAR|nr:hypothetical protein F5050DRAFT_32500 [Lentinula boryana]
MEASRVRKVISLFVSSTTTCHLVGAAGLSEDLHVPLALVVEEPSACSNASETCAFFFGGGGGASFSLVKWPSIQSSE